MRIVKIALSALLALALSAPSGALAKSKKGGEQSASMTKQQTTAATSAETGTAKKGGKKKSAEAKSKTKAEVPAAGTDKEHEGMVYVKGYTKKDGTKVEGYWRKKPGAK